MKKLPWTVPKIEKKCQRTLSDSRSSARPRAKELLCLCAAWWDLKLGWCPQTDIEIGRLCKNHRTCERFESCFVSVNTLHLEIYLERPLIVQTIQNQSTMQIHPTSISHDLLKDVKEHEERKIRELNVHYYDSCTSLGQAQQCLQYAPPGKLVWSGVQKKTAMMQFLHATSFQNPYPGSHYKQSLLDLACDLVIVWHCATGCNWVKVKLDCTSSCMNLEDHCLAYMPVANTNRFCEFLQSADNALWLEDGQNLCCLHHWEMRKAACREEIFWKWCQDWKNANNIYLHRM